MAKINFSAINPDDLKLTPRVALVQEWFDDAATNGVSVAALSMFAAFCKLLWNADGIVEITLPETRDLLEYTLSIDNPRPGVVRFLLMEPE